MKNSNKFFFFYLMLLITVGFISCEDSSYEVETELTIQKKVELLESSEWLLKGFENSVMHTFEDGKKHTFYAIDNVFGDEAIPGTQAYVIEGNSLKIDYNFGNITTYEVKFSCNNYVVTFYKEGELNSTLYKRGSNYEECL